MKRKGNSKIANGAQLARQSWDALRANPQLMIFPAVSLVATLIISLLYLGVVFGFEVFMVLPNGETEVNNVLAFIITFIYYLVLYTVIIFSNVALVGVVMKLLRGETATVQDGIAIAQARIGKILVYALISATVGMIARGIAQAGRESNNVVIAIITAIIGGILQGAWNLLVFFAIPVLVIEDVSVMDSFKRSFEIFKRTWGEGFIGSTAISIIGCLATLAILVVGGGLIMLAVASESVALIVLSVLLVVVAFVGVGLVNSAINGVFQASLYQYATTGEAGLFIDTELARNAFGTGEQPSAA